MRSRKSGALGASMISSWAGSTNGAIWYAADDEKHTAAEPGTASASKPSRTWCVPTRSTSNTRRASAIVGEIPAACTNARNGPSSRTRSTSAPTAPGSATSHATPTVPSMAGAFRSPATNTSALATVSLPGARVALPGKPAGPVGCDAGRLAGTHHPGDTRSHPANVAGCVSYTHAGYGESWLIVTPPIVSNGTTVPSAVIRGGPYQDHPTAQLPSFGIARSVDEGAHWANLQ